MSSTESARPPSGLSNPFGIRSQSSRDFGSYEMYGTPGILEEGIMVRQRQELIRLPDVSKMLAEISVEESRVSQVKAGMVAYIQVRNIPDRRFKGTVRRVALLPDAQASWMNPNKKVFPTDILIEEELPILKPGVSTSVEIIITNLTKVLSVPIQTVTRSNGEKVCFIKKGSRVTAVPVTTGWFNDAFVEITAGLKEGDFVLLAPVGDEDEEADEETDAAETNQVDSPTPPHIEPAVNGQRTPGRNAEPNGNQRATESPRNRPGAPRRSPNPQTAPE